MVAGGPGRTLGTGTGTGTDTGTAPARWCALLEPGCVRTGALEEMLAGTMEGETLDDTSGILFAALVVIPLVVVGLTPLVSDR